MLPEKLSTNLTSLNFGEDRLANVVEMIIQEDGTLLKHDHLSGAGPQPRQVGL